ncbi:hypothetical protein [Asticcacaulis sp. EMRT-3]|nr:hypothetical protein [Asticcacaulis sp. EMRT-3]MDI7775212.1 hypothetical protein [Asticcacaulis sp. EMRT-3]
MDDNYLGAARGGKFGKPDDPLCQAKSDEKAWTQLLCARMTSLALN